MSITLTTPFTVSIGGVQVENDTVGACTSIATDFLARTLTATFQIGTLTGSPANLNAGPQGLIQNQGYVIVVHLDTGAWSDNHGHSGTVPAGTLANQVSQALSDRNSAEAFMAVPGGLMPGTTVAWISI
jgi:hypothetical protein